MKKLYVSDIDIREYVNRISFQMYKDNWRPDYIVGITRGGSIPAVLLSQYLEIPMQSLDVSLRDGGSTVSNCGMAEDAFGYNAAEVGDPLCKNILVVDDINDQGSTIAWIKKDWQESCLPNDARWEHVWGQNVRFATLTNNLASKEDVDYSVWEVNKVEEDCWLVYPWEDFWL